MTQEEKQLLLKDLCARLPYGFTIYRHSDNANLKISDIDNFAHFLEYSEGEEFKPYLRPMESMTEEESKEFALLQTDFYTDGILYPIAAINMIGWLNAHHFDYRGLIPMGLALEAPKDMYKIVLEAPKDMYKTE